MSDTPGVVSSRSVDSNVTAPFSCNAKGLNASSRNGGDDAAPASCREPLARRGRNAVGCEITSSLSIGSAVSVEWLWIGLNADAAGMTRCVTSPSTSVEPALPLAVGPLSGAVLDVLSQRPLRRHLARIEAPVGDSDPFGLDLQLALYVCDELHYRGFAGVDPRWEWNPSLLHLRGLLEESFWSVVKRAVGELAADQRAADMMEALSVEPVDGEGPS